ncbi:tetratricopeptide (TPR) repeat protein [Neisseria perflava]|uniref:tetratricopeptide repeat protein n=1 Tax=Neisseria perflava TaxID=33053 RepID=UPI0020A101DC|nr:tetratricopeptide repeat protein [Neisseria perflava]MCP1772036.1 tetratricopeptide (TPR) repeat protein [Neisseria perflava]
MSNPLETLKAAINAQQWQDIPALADRLAESVPLAQRARLLSNIGVLLAEAKQEALAAEYFERALRAGLQDDRQARIAGNLASILSRLQRYDEACYWGAESVRLRDEAACQGQFTRRLAAFSLYGANPAYCESLILNAQRLPELYPGWEMRVYHDKSVPKQLLSRLQALGVECVDVTGTEAQQYPGTFWRFLALEEDFDAVVLRDADSVMNEREQTLVNAWLASDKPFHIMRDWYTETNLIMAGMWGVRHGLLSGIRAWIKQFVAAGNLHPTHADQYFLERYVWPRIKKYALHHDSVLGLPDTQWPSELPRYNEINGKMQPLGSWQLAEFIPDTDKPYGVYLYDGQGREICQYSFEAGQHFELPQSYKDNIDSGLWRMEVKEQMQIAVSLPGGGKSTATVIFNRKKKQPKPE